MDIDRITFVGDFAKHLNLKNKVGEYDYDAMLPTLSDSCRRTFAKWPYRYQITTDDGMTISLADRKAPVPPVRFDFNPQTCDYVPYLNRFKGCLSHVRVTRLDYAQDYDLDLSRVNFQLKSAVKSCQFLSRSGALETLYLGAAQSPLRFRIYNKAKEQNEDGLRWRIEAQCRFKPDDDWWFFMPFENFVMTRPTFDGLKVQERAMLSYLQENSSAWGELSRPAKTKYKKLLRETGAAPAILHPHNIHMSECIKLKKEVMKIISLTEYKKPII